MAAGFWGTPQDADAEGAWHVVIAEGGTYPDGNLTLRPDIPFQGIVFMGPALVNAGGGIWTWIPSTPRFVVGDPALHVCSVVGGADLSSVLVNGRLRIGDTGAGTAKTFASSGITWGLAVEDDVTQNLGQTNVQIHGGNAHGSLNLAAGVAQIRDAVYGGLVNLTALEWCRDSEFQDAITVAAAGSRALTDTFIAGNFTGPAGSFRADQVTLQNFGGAFAGGASAADVIET